MAMHFHQKTQVVFRIRAPAHHHLVGQNPEGVNVGALIQRVALDLFGGHVIHGASEIKILRADGTGQSKVQDFKFVARQNDDVGGIDIPVNNPLAVGILKAAANLI